MNFVPQPSRDIENLIIVDVTELPPKFQHAYEAAKAKADLAHINLTQADPAVHVISRLKLIQDVVFAYCAQARAAGREGKWTVAQVRRATDAAWPAICDFYFVREHGVHSEEMKLQYRAALWQATENDLRWKQHLAELVELVERDSNTSRVGDGEDQPHSEASERAMALSDLFNLSSRDTKNRAGIHGRTSSPERGACSPHPVREFGGRITSVTGRG
ncbi:MAG: hypothetical protein ABSB35_36260 [Bryobacteraceae bacterium]